jgi:acetolactate synthase-1/2/3 large subunit
MPEQSGGDAIVSMLAALGVRHVFGIVSVHNLPIFDAIARDPRIELVPVRHEQGGVHAADGYARATGSLGVVIASTGPGTANGMGGLFEAAYASSPVLLITGQVETAYLGKGQGYIHNADRQAEMLGAVVRRAATVTQRADLVPLFTEVVTEMLRGRPMPTAIEIPIDLQSAKYDDPEFRFAPPAPDAPDPTALATAAAALASAETPLIWAGGGIAAAGASEALLALAERLNAPVLTSIEGRGAIPEDHPLSLGPNADMTVIDPTIAGADVVLAVGTRFQLATPMARALTIPGRLIHLDADPTVIGLVHPAAIALVGDARLGLESLLESIPAGSANPEFATAAAAARKAVDAETRDAIGSDYSQLIDVIRAALPRDAIVVKDTTISATIWANRALPVYLPRTSIRAASMAIGPGVPLAMGAAIGSGQPTVVIQGDGGLMLSVGELATIVQQAAPVVVCVFNDGGYGILRYIQKVGFEGRHSGVDLVTPDFVALAGSLGLAATSVSGVDEFANAFTAALASGKPHLLDIDVASLAPIEIRSQRAPTRLE